MSRIDELIAELCPDGVEYKKLGEITVIKRGERITKADIVPSGKYPIISGGTKPLGNYDKYNRDPDTITIAQYGTAGFVDWQYDFFWANDVCYSVYLFDILNNRYLYFTLLKLQDFLYSIRTNAVPAHLPIDKLKSIEIPIPPIPIQHEIVRILDTFTDLDAELQSELEARKKQYEHYRDQLLNFEGKEVEWKTLGGANGIAEIGTGSRNTVDATENGKYPFYVRSANIMLIDNYEFDEEAILTSGDGVGVGKILHYVNGKYGLHQRAYRFRMKHGDISTKYVFYCMKNTFKKYILGSAVNSSVTSVRRPMLEKYKIPIPPLPEQERIVSILDKFETLVNVELPAEIAARRKQYEYYREKLLTFKKVD